MAKSKQSRSPRAKAAPIQHSTDHSAKIEIAGKTYSHGDLVTINGDEYTAEAVHQLPATDTSGVSAGTYPVVSEMIGTRRAYRALVGDQLYPVRQYGTENQVLAKQRESRKGNGGEVSPRARPSVDSQSLGDDNVCTLTSDAVVIVREYLQVAPRGGPGRDRLVSEVIVKHLGPEVARLRSEESAIANLPRDFLLALAHLSEEKRREIMAGIGK